MTTGNYERNSEWKERVYNNPERNRKIAEALKGNKNCLGKKNGLGYKHTIKAKQAIHEAVQKRIGEGSHNFLKKNMNPNWKPPMYIDGRSKWMAPARYGDDWDKVRYLVYLRDKFTCQDCGVSKQRLDVHHIIPFLISFDNSLSNLVALCRSCHMKTEWKIIMEVKNYGS